MPSAYEIYTNGLLLDSDDPKHGPDRLYKFQQDFEEKISQSAAGTLKQFFVSDSKVVTANHTAHRVRGATPDCGAGIGTVDEQTSKYATALEKLGQELDKKLGTGGLFTAVSEVIGALVTLGNTYQKTSNCADSVVIVPACFTDITKLTVRQYVGLGTSPVVGPGGERPMPDGWGDWMHLEPPVLSQKTFKLSTEDTPDQDPLRGKNCEFKIVTTRIRNWSRSRNVSLLTRVYWDAPAPGCECIDFTMTSEAYRTVFFDSFMDRDLLQRYATEYFGEQYS